MSTPSPARRLLAWLPVVAWAGLIFFLSAQPRDKLPDFDLLNEALSVGAHLLAYGVLMTLLVLALRQRTTLSGQKLVLVALVLVAFYALSDEYHQSFVPGRTASVLDILTDLAGALVALRVMKSAGLH